MSQRRIHDPIIDTFEDSDEEKVEEIIDSSEHHDNILPTHEQSLHDILNGDSIDPSGELNFKKTSLVHSDEAIDLDPDPMNPFTMDITDIPNSQIRTKDQNFTLIPDSLPSHVMELDSPEHSPEYLCGTEDSVMPGTSLSSDVMPGQSLGYTHLSPEAREIAIQQAAKEIMPAPTFTNGDDFDEERTAAVTYSQSDIFASQPLFGIEPTPIIESSENDSELETRKIYDEPQIIDSSKELNPFEVHSPKRKREDEEDFKQVKKANLKGDTQEADIEILSESNHSVEIIYDKKEEKDLGSCDSQNIQLFLSTQSESQTASDSPCVIKPPPEQSRFDALNATQVHSLSIQSECRNFSSNDEEYFSVRESAMSRSSTNLPSFDTPSQLTSDESEQIFAKANKEALLRNRKSAENGQYLDTSSSPTVIPIEKSISVSTPNSIPSGSKQSTPIKNTPNIFGNQDSQKKQNSSKILAVDSDDEDKQKETANRIAKDDTVNGDDTEKEVYLEKSDINSIEDLNNSNWRNEGFSTIQFYLNPVTQEYVFTYNDETIFKDWNSLISCIEKTRNITRSNSGSSKASRISNISSISRVTSMSGDGYLGDKSSMSSGYSEKFESTRRSLASVISLSPPKAKSMKPPEFVPKLPPKSIGVQTESSSDTSPINRPRSKPRTKQRGQKKYPAIAEEPSLSSASLETTVPEEEKTTEKTVQPSKEKEPENFLNFLSDSLYNELKQSQAPFSEDDNEFFIKEGNNMKHSNESQNAYIRKRVREVDISDGMIVFARYNSDKSYYSAIIQSKDKLDRWKIRFNLDNQICSVRELFILPADILPRGFPLYVRQQEQDIYEGGIVKGHQFKNEILLHIVELTRGRMTKVPHSHLVLKEQHANVFLEHRTKFRSLASSPSLGWENIVEGKRRGHSASPRVKKDPNFDTSADEAPSRKNKRPNRVVSLPGSESSDSSKLSSPKTPKQSRTPRTPKSKKSSTPVSTLLKQVLIPIVRHDENELSKSSSKVSTSKNASKSETKPYESPKRAIKSLDSPKRATKSLDSPKRATKSLNSPKSTGKRTRRTASSKTAKKVRKLEYAVDDELGPIPEEGIFEGYTILVTESINQRVADFNPTPLDKDYMSVQIANGGGRLVSCFEEASTIQAQEAKKLHTRNKDSERIKIRDSNDLPAIKSPAKVLCISNAPCRTAKFIQCLTFGIPIISSTWVIDSCKRNLCLNWANYLLPAGKCLFTGEMMSQVFDNDLTNKTLLSNIAKVPEILKGEKVFLATSSNPDFKNTWCELLTTAEAQVFMKNDTGKLSRLMDRNTSVIIADSSIPSDEQQRAEDIKAPIVSTEWFIQCVIQRCKVDYTAHPKFKYNYSETDDR